MSRRTLLIGVTLMAMLVAAPFARAAITIRIDEYVSSLERMHSLISANQLDAAKAEASRLSGATVVASTGNFMADASLLHAIGSAKTPDRRLLIRIETLTRALRESGARGVAARPDPQLLDRIAQRQAAPELEAGGDVNTTVTGETALLEQIAGSIVAMYRWLSDKIGNIIDWLIDLLPGSERREREQSGGLRSMVVAVVVLITATIALLAYQVLRRTRPAGGELLVSAEAAGSRRDDDPLSRGASEWERYAAQLASEERYREAIRAWYHAVLVTCYALGVLHFRKGRTNWEYVAALAPSIPWRGEMIQLTRRFELEWYGHDRSSAEALDVCASRARTILDALRQRGAA